MSSDKPLITLVVPTHNRYFELERCLRSFERFAKGCPVLVVDDGGTDDTEQMVKRKFPYVKYVSYKTNRGPAYARNRALDAVETPYLAFFDSDILLGPTWLDTVSNTLAPDTILAGRVDRPDGSVEWGPRKTMSWGGSIACPDKYANVASSNNMLVPLSLARSIGGFSEELGIYFEDTYFCICARRANYKVRYVDGARVTHYHDSRPNPWRIRRLLRNRTFCMIRDSRAPLVMTALQMVITLVEVIVALLKKRQSLASECFKGFWCGVRDSRKYRVTEFTKSNGS